MKTWTEDELVQSGYKLENAEIGTVSLNMKEHGCLFLEIPVCGNGWGCVLGGYVLGKGYLGAKSFSGSAAGTESIMRIMDVVGVDDLNKMKGEKIRVATRGWGSRPTIIGNIIQDKWFDYESFFADKQKEAVGNEGD